MRELIADFLANPNGDAFPKLRAAVIQSPDYRFYDDGLRELEALPAETPPELVLTRVPDCIPSFLLTPRLHQLLARVARANGEADRAKMELHFAHSCIQGILSHGTGTADAPFPVTHVEDEYDILDHLGVAVAVWRREVADIGILDIASTEDGRSIYFDITSSAALTYGGGPARS